MWSGRVTSRGNQEHQEIAVLQNYKSAIDNGEENLAKRIRDANPDIVTDAWVQIIREGGTPRL